MIFADLLPGESVFVDANTLVYHFEPHPVYGPACTALVKRIELREIAGYTSTHVVAEMAHHLMTLEAMRRVGWPATGIAQKLRKHPSEVQKAMAFRQAIQAIPKLGIQVLLLLAPLLDSAAAISQQTGLLTNDALIVAAMQHHGLTKLASNDADFDRVSGLTPYAPA